MKIYHYNVSDIAKRILHLAKKQEIKNFNIFFTTLNNKVYFKVPIGIQCFKYIGTIIYISDTSQNKRKAKPNDLKSFNTSFTIGICSTKCHYTLRILKLKD